MNRNTFLRITGGSGLLVATAPLVGFSIRQEEQLDKKVVQEFVGASHGKMDVVKSLLEEYPNLINAAHDWKNGDFETGLGAATHVGYKELAQYFLEKGAQANVFTACLFGKIDIIKPMLTAFPNTLHAKGPHGFTLLHHAQKGGDEAMEVKEYLESLGATETKISLY